MSQSSEQRDRVPALRIALFERDQVWSAYVNLIQSKNAEALSKLYDESSSLVFSVALRILENRADAEEVTLDVFSQIWNNAAAWDPQRGTVTAWIVLLARSRALDRGRWRKTRTKAEVPEQSLYDPISKDQNPEDAIQIRQRRERVRAAMVQLSDAQRVALELAFFGGLTHAEISVQLGEPLGTIKSRLRSAMLRLKDLLESQEEQNQKGLFQ